MIYFPETINTVSTLNTITLTRSLVLSQLCTPLTLCMLASWSHEGAVFLDVLSSSHPITSSLFPYLGSTDAPCSCLGVSVPPSPKWRPPSQGPRTLPYRDPEQLLTVLQPGNSSTTVLSQGIVIRHDSSSTELQPGNSSTTELNQRILIRNASASQFYRASVRE